MSDLSDFTALLDRWEVKYEIEVTPVPEPPDFDKHFPRTPLGQLQHLQRHSVGNRLRDSPQLTEKMLALHREAHEKEEAKPDPYRPWPDEPGDQTLTVAEGSNKVGGYFSFYTAFCFDKDGTFKGMGAWE